MNTVNSKRSAALVSIVVPTYNRESTINRALESVFAQTHKELEVIVVDDGSTDGTEKLLHETWGDAVRYVRQENQGACVARNTGVSLASGEYIAFLDSDDEWLPGKIEKQLAEFEVAGDPELGLVLCAYKSIVLRYEKNAASTYEWSDLGRPAIQGWAFESLIARDPLVMGAHIGFMSHRRVFEAGVKFDSDQPAFQDLDFLLNATKRFKVRTVPEVLLIAYKDDGGEHVHSGRNLLDGRLRLLKKFAPDLESRPTLYARHHKAVARYYFNEGEIEGVRKHLRAAHELKPSASTLFWLNLTYLNWWTFKATLRSIRKVTRTLTRLRLARMYGPFV